MSEHNMMQLILLGERTSITSQDELTSASVVQPSMRADALQELVKEQSTLDEKEAETCHHADTHTCCCVSYDWLNIDSVRCEYNSDIDEVNEFIKDQVERERCAEPNIIITGPCVYMEVVHESIAAYAWYTDIYTYDDYVTADDAYRLRTPTHGDSTAIYAAYMRMPNTTGAASSTLIIELLALIIIPTISIKTHTTTSRCCGEDATLYIGI